MVVRLPEAEVLRQRAGFGRAAREGVFALAHAGGRGAEDERDPPGAVAPHGPRHRLGEAVRQERHPPEPVVAAVERRKIPRDRPILDALDAPYEGIEPRVLVVAAPQPRPALPQRVRRGIQPGAQRIHRRERVDRERRHAGRPARGAVKASPSRKESVQPTATVRPICDRTGTAAVASRAKPARSVP